MKKQISNVVVWAAAAMAAVPSVAAAEQAAQQSGPAAQQATPATAVQVQTQDTYVVGRALPPDTPGVQRVDLTLQQAIDRALEKNLDIQSAKLSPQMQDYTLAAARAAFRPTFNSSYSYNNTSRVSTSQLDGGARVTSVGNTLNSSISKRLYWQGATTSISFNNGRDTSSAAFSIRNPSYSSNLSLQYQQPLLAGRKIDNQRNSLETGQIQRAIVDSQLQAQIEQVRNQVRTAYWSLRQALESIEIQRRALELSKRNYDDNKVKVEVGTVAEIDLVQLESQIANGEQAVLNAEITWRNAEIALKTLLVDDADDELYKSTINPTELPTFEMVTVDIPSAVTRAIAQRTDIEQARQQMKITELNLSLSKDQTRSSLGFTGTYRLAGTGGNEYSRSGLGGTAVLINESGYLDALREIGQLKTPTWTLALNFSRPLGLSSQKANFLRAELGLEQAKSALKKTELTIETAVTRAGLDVQNTYKQLLAAQKSRQAAERSLDAELTRFSVGMSTNFQVISLQNTLTTARNSELSATIRYINAIAEFDRVQKIQ